MELKVCVSWPLLLCFQNVMSPNVCSTLLLEYSVTAGTNLIMSVLLYDSIFFYYHSDSIDVFLPVRAVQVRCDFVSYYFVDLIWI